jgi:hypothetical protein
MDRLLFASRNVFDKLKKTVGSWETTRFYLRTYLLSRLEAVEPDVYVVSYPKCGRTWLRLLLQRCFELAGSPTQPHHDGSIVDVPGKVIVKFEHDQGNWVPAPRPLAELRYNAAKYSGKRLVFLVRDPRDVLVSSWYHLRYRERIYREPLGNFVHDDLVGIEKVVRFMNMFIEHQDEPAAFLLMTYEQMRADPLTETRRLLQFICHSLDDAVIAQAVEACSFHNMKKMEADGSLREPWMKPGAKGQEKSMKIRKGKIGGYRDELSAGDVDFLDRVIRSRLTPALPYARD